jgi:hypothetical protein
MYSHCHLNSALLQSLMHEPRMHVFCCMLFIPAEMPHVLLANYATVAEVAEAFKKASSHREGGRALLVLPSVLPCVWQCNN